MSLGQHLKQTLRYALGLKRYTFKELQEMEAEAEKIKIDKHSAKIRSKQKIDTPFTTEPQMEHWPYDKNNNNNY